MAGYAVKQFDLVKNSTHRDKVLIASLNLARAKLFRGEHQYAVKMANYVSIGKFKMIREQGFSACSSCGLELLWAKRL